MKPVITKSLIAVVSLLLLAGVAYLAQQRIAQMTGPGAQRGRGGQAGPAPVEIGPVERGTILWQRTFSGTLESRASMAVASKIAGRVERVAVDLADLVERGQVVAQLEDDEHEQAVAQSAAELAVARASLAEARSGIEAARRELERVKTLSQRGVASESQLDVAEATALAKGAAVEVALAQVTRAEAALESARIRLGYTGVTATWTGGNPRRVVAQRFVEEGDTVAANEALLSVVELDPIDAVIFVTERDYARLTPKQPVELTTDAHPGRVFTGAVGRIAPVFQETSRQARIEIDVPNGDGALKPGMFIRARVVLDRADDATIVPAAALATRDDRAGVFVVDASGDRVSWRPVRVGIRDGDRVQVIGEGVEGAVVTLGQQLIGDGSKITVPRRDGRPTTAAAPPGAGRP